MDYRTALTHLHECGIKTDEVIIDGQLHRAPTVHKPKKENGWYICFPPDVLIVGDWMTGVKQTFTSGTKKKASKDQWRKVKLEMEKAKALLQERQDDAALLANHIYSCSSNQFVFMPYLNRKQIKPTADMRCYWNEQTNSHEIIIPLIDLESGEICNIQRITYERKKLFLAGARVTGLCFPVGLIEPPTKLLICEGVATAISLYDHSRTPTLAALNTGNLKAIATQARLLWPDAELVICADDDYITEQRIGTNPGLTKANEAALASLSSVSVPPFTLEQKLAGNTDWNDYFCLVKKQGRVA